MSIVPKIYANIKRKEIFRRVFLVWGGATLLGLRWGLGVALCECLLECILDAFPDLLSQCLRGEVFDDATSDGTTQHLGTQDDNDDKHVDGKRGERTQQECQIRAYQGVENPVVFAGEGEPSEQGERPHDP
ncbi:MAG: hypothetical protein COV59_00700 [Candidatus Magasanikbacteria bacterium CG11_big_fil_rev_8_21_14_0_20_39_34]|uniref:Uncharacterized protein n=1 Tax=Candidatus Magasanikbacteria bacterium CG11_big_fil_rev_8_21_14_0_20_39_34 TaxID=1974653 RepID=A0A2H0N6G0_9BACT|nr:MAG: hypothetical protein COV59_00700 [Candidatus Magasanikbacteria bacterium CG11_big_fil_rev_8_21_14_0_20_39_34]